MKQVFSQLLLTVLLLLGIAITAYGVERFVGTPGTRVADIDLLDGAGAASIRSIAASAG